MFHGNGSILSRSWSLRAERAQDLPSDVASLIEADARNGSRDSPAGELRQEAVPTAKQMRGGDVAYRRGQRRSKGTE